MSYVAGIDLSSRAIDIVKLEESSNRAEWFRYELVGASAWERTRTVRDALPSASWWDDVYLAAVETPFPDQQGVLRRVQGAVLACIPAPVLVWEAGPKQWKKGLGLSGNASKAECGEAALELLFDADFGQWNRSVVAWPQDALDAYAIALWARQENAKGLSGVERSEAA